MDSTRLKLNGSWNDVKGKMKKEYGDLTDDDLTYEEGRDDEFLGKLQKKLGKTKEELKAWIERL
jgi:uncharacterized protein YjbJ (UPF0337 family)